jgi:hypothetical protein
VERGVQERLVGRREELWAIEGFLGGVGSGFPALAIEGEAGIGKSRLWQEAVERARRRGFRSLVARPVGSEVRLSFAGLADVLGGLAADGLPRLAPPQRRAKGRC